MVLRSKFSIIKIFLPLPLTFNDLTVSGKSRFNNNNFSYKISGDSKFKGHFKLLLAHDALSNHMQKQPPDVFCKQGCSYRNIHRKLPVLESLFNKVAGRALQFYFCGTPSMAASVFQREIYLLCSYGSDQTLKR